MKQLQQPSKPRRVICGVALGLLCLYSLGCGTSFAEEPSELSSPARISMGHAALASSNPEGQWSATGFLASARLLHTATRLADGRVLAVGGYNRTAELYNPDTGTWSVATEALNTHRGATATLLRNGRVLLAGVGGAEWNSGISTEEYEPVSGRWEAKGNQVTPRLYHTATLLPDGRVLVTGGASSEYGGTVLATAEVYDSATGRWTTTGSMAVARRNHTATLLSNGQVLVTGGTHSSSTLQNSAEVYDAATGTWSPVGSMAVGRAHHRATRLSNGKVLVVGGSSSDWSSSASVELFNPATRSWEATGSLSKPRRQHSATLLPSGQVLVAGGFHEYTGILTAAEVYDPTLGTWQAAGNMATGRYSHTATLLPSGQVLVAGGFSNGNEASAEVYAPAGTSVPEQSTEPAGTSVLLEVVDTEGHPIPGAVVSSQNAVFPVDSSGHRLFENLPPGRFLARVDALGFTSATVVVEPQPGAHVGVQVELIAHGPPLAFQAEQGGTLQTEQVRVTLHPNAIVDALGQPVTGTVEVTIAPLDPTTQLAAMPGPLEGLPTQGTERMQLESYFMAEVSLWSNGAPVQLAPGSSATLEFVLPDSLASRFQVGASVPAWWFDLDAGHWREEGSGIIQPSQVHPGKLAWVVQVSHFTWWNCDAPWTDKSCVNVNVMGPQGPVAGALVSVRGVSYTGATTHQFTNASGQVCLEIKRDNTADVFAGFLGHPATSIVRVTGSQTAAVCGTGPCTTVTLSLPGMICSPGAYQDCPYTGPMVGVCRGGVQRCNVTGTQWSECQGEVLPANGENCHNRFDDDCDGVVNERCPCSDQVNLPCYTGPVGTQGVGSCHGGMTACGGPFGSVSCDGQRLPQTEDCLTPALEDCNCDGVIEPSNRDPSGWISTGSMASARPRNTATLTNGLVLITGGKDESGPLRTAELYNPATGTFTATGSMTAGRYNHTATRLRDGRVLVVGGYGNNGYLATAEVYNPATGTWSATAGMTFPRYFHTATLLANGKVLVAGGANFGGPIPAVEVYDPATGTWSAARSMASPRYGHAATLLLNGRVLITGGDSSTTTIATTELYDPITGFWSPAASMTSPRVVHSATLLSNGKVLVAGGFRQSGHLVTAEVYDSSTNSWSAITSMASARYLHTATRLANGHVLIAGGANGSDAIATAEVYNPSTSSWTSVGSMATARYRHSATLLPNGKVLIVGGAVFSSPHASAELYTR